MMSDYILDSTGQLVPEPIPPGDDELPPCPVCGGGGETWLGHVECTGCEFDVRVDDWRRLARAVALLKAVMDVSSTLRIDVPGDGSVRRSYRYCGISVDADTVLDALIALATALE